MDIRTRDLPDELRNFAQYARSVAADSVGPHRLTWQERAEWADACAAAAQGAVEALENAREFIKSATSWEGQQDDQEEALDELARTLDRLGGQ